MNEPQAPPPPTTTTTFTDRIEDESSSFPEPVSLRHKTREPNPLPPPPPPPPRMDSNAWPRLLPPPPPQQRNTAHRGGKRHRKLLPLSIFLRPLGNAANLQKYSSNSWWGQFGGSPGENTPDTAHLTQLLAALLLTTALGGLSALDAKYHCLKHETSAMGISNDNNGVDNDDEVYQAALEEARRIEADGCLKMFRGVCLPVLGTTLGLGLLGLWILLRKKKEGKKRVTPQAAVRWMAALLVILIGILVAQTYLVTHIMLRPRMQDDSENPFHSLGAVDVSGQIGDNANLYYLVWVSEILSITLVYQTVNELGHARRAADQAALAQGLLPATSWWIMDEEYDRQNHQSRHTWYKSIYKLRVRTGIWTAALITCLVLTASAQYVWRQFMWPYVLQEDGSLSKSKGSGESIFDPMDFSVCQTMAMNSNWVISVTLCRRTVMAWFSGAVSFLLSAFSIGMHLVARARAHGLVTNEHRQQLFYMQRINIFRKLLNRHRVPLGIELILSLVLSLLLGFNAALSTGVQGPATKVGNLYYASWGAFLLVVRIGIGCLEEWYEVEPKDEKTSAAPEASAPSEQAKKVVRRESSVGVPNDAVDNGGEEKEFQILDGGEANDSQASFETETSDLSGTSSVMMDHFEKERVKRLRTYFFLCIFSTCCASATFDAAVNQKHPLTKVHRYMMLSPCVVASQSLILFFLCLSKKCYLVASHVCIGGILSVLSFGLWLADLVLTMHSEDSWAVNGIGEIRMANLYYFTWASILTAGT